MLVITRFYGRYKQCVEKSVRIWEKPPILETHVQGRTDDKAAKMPVRYMQRAGCGTFVSLFLVWV